MSVNGSKILSPSFNWVRDVEYAKYWTETYGYDYSDPNNARKQTAILELVKAEVWRVREGMFPSSRPEPTIACPAP